MSQTEEGVFSAPMKHILAVDDTAIILTRIMDALRNDYEVTTINSGIRALKYLQ